MKDVCKDIEEPIENGDNPIDIAIQKAIFYSNYCPENSVILTQDDTIVFEGIKEEDSPGTHIKKPVIDKYGKFTDELAAKYYVELANKYGGSIPMIFNYGHAIAIKQDDERNTKIVFGAGSKLPVRLINKINKLEKVPGYFLSAIMQVYINDKWEFYNDLDDKIITELDVDLYNSITMLLKRINY